MSQPARSPENRRADIDERAEGEQHAYQGGKCPLHAETPSNYESVIVPGSLHRRHRGPSL
jgi:hypothetical protein